MWVCDYLPFLKKNHTFTHEPNFMSMKIILTIGVEKSSFVHTLHMATLCSFVPNSEIILTRLRFYEVESN